MLDFPSAPALNDAYRDWAWDGEKWLGPPRVSDPAGNGAYGRQNGVWVPVVWRQRIDVSGLNAVDVLVPAGAKMMRWMFGPQQVGTTVGLIGMQWSTDGTTFWTGATNYGVSGVLHGINPSTFGKIATTYGTLAYMSWTHNNAGFPHLSRGFLLLTRPSESVTLFSFLKTEVYNASYTGMAVHVNGWSNGITGLAIQKIKIFLSGGALFAANTQIGLEWVA